MAEARIGPIALPAAGARAAGRFTFARDAGLEKYDWPYLAISGVSSGPVVLVTAGIHAAEYTGIEAAIRLGRSLDLAFPEKVAPPAQAPVVLSVRGLARPPQVQDVSLDIRAGEIVGLAGLIRAERLRESRGRR